MIELPTVTGHLPELLRYLDDGWHIEAPLLQRSALHGIDGRSAVLEIVLRKERQRRVIAVGDDVEVRHFFESRRLPILEI